LAGEIAMPDLLDAQLLFAEHAFESPLPIPSVIDTARRPNITIQVREFEQFLGLYDGEGNPLDTTVWGFMAGGYGGFPGPTIVAYRDQPISIRWQNMLPVHGHLLPVDTTVHLAQPVRGPLEDGYVPIVMHLHGGHNLSAFDGTPEQWFTQVRSGPGGRGPRETGPDFVSSTMRYENDQQSATLWYHDHSLGMTRLNVYAGLAGFYVLQDDERLELVRDGVLPGGTYDIGMAIQDRAFTSDGQLYYPAYRSDPLPGTDETVGDLVPQAFYEEFGDTAASIVPEFFGDTILVNGMAWPNLDVAAGSYEFRLLNGSDSRFYILTASDPDVAIYLVGTDGGLLPEAITISDGDGVQEAGEFILLAPGDRVELVFDFSKLSGGETVRLLNSGPAFEPFKGVTTEGILLGEAEAAGPGDPVGNIMQFTVSDSIAPFHARLFNGEDPAPLAASFVRLASDENGDGIADAATSIRNLGLFETAESFGRVTPMLGKAESGTITANDEDVSANFGPLSYNASATERPTLGSTEQWNIFNFTADTHPLHLHLVQYQVVEKREILFRDEDENGLPDDTTGDGLISYGSGPTPDYSSADIWIGELIPLRPEETGWQDTVHIDPGTMASIVATFDLPGLYVWHCHILSHEDNEMMRPIIVEEEPFAMPGMNELSRFADHIRHVPDDFFH
jgi:spore coat protein A